MQLVSLHAPLDLTAATIESSLVESTVHQDEMEDLVKLQHSNTLVDVVAHWESEVQPEAID